MSPKFLEVVEDESLCEAYFELANTNIIELPDAIAMAKKFRITMGGQNWPYQKTKGYFIPRDSVKTIFKQNQGEIRGLKIYFARKNR